MQLYHPSKCIQSESPTHPSPPPITPQTPQFIKWMLKLYGCFYFIVAPYYNVVDTEVKVILQVKD